MIVSVPTLEVSRITVFLKSISRPSPSSSVPLSKTWKNSSSTSGWAFSTSSSSTTLYGLAADGLGQHAPLAVADVARRRALQAGDRVRLLVLRHVDRDQVALAAVERVGQGQGGLGLADAAGADQQEHADRPARVGQVGAGGPDPLGDRLQGVRLADDALLQLRSRG